MNKTNQAIAEMVIILAQQKIKFVVTRFNKTDDNAGDLDVLVKPSDFIEVKKALTINGYKSFSHDRAFGGRLLGKQVNLVKKSRVKIDLHQDFTWRGSRYLDTNFIWVSTKMNRIGKTSVLIPSKSVDSFLELINWIFERTYITKKEFTYYWQDIKKAVLIDPVYYRQALKFGWGNTFIKFKRWSNVIYKPDKFPIFLPFHIILYSYFEQLINKKTFNLTSFLYYLFFYLRFAINKRLPYD